MTRRCCCTTHYDCCTGPHLQWGDTVKVSLPPFTIEMGRHACDDPSIGGIVQGDVVEQSTVTLEATDVVLHWAAVTECTYGGVGGATSGSFVLSATCTENSPCQLTSDPLVYVHDTTYDVSGSSSFLVGDPGTYVAVGISFAYADVDHCKAVLLIEVGAEVPVVGDCWGWVDCSTGVTGPTAVSYTGEAYMYVVFESDPWPKGSPPADPSTLVWTRTSAICGYSGAPHVIDWLLPDVEVDYADCDGGDGVVGGGTVGCLGPFDQIFEWPVTVLGSAVGGPEVPLVEEVP